ncbi:MAG: sulfoxide reductase heme-binding subunit YedZ [Gammaproteobacteria bacterium]|nr:sulfoxide reductase heme-binding subunit YedZ [Gammaproteobacteria bacterium]MCZ6497895.1 sulfoxide reductase heme-binding subunit YedZ [Gammaproteobacteria bacterium]MCZ6585025.1 sulfoxide reductase heme-binding subunit YedZ [Gammaproteobacteria bacterium]
MTRRSLTLLKAFVALACSIPFLILVARIAGFGSLGANPIQEVLHTLGKTGLNLLLLTLTITPLRRLTGLNWLVALRRTLGLSVFGYILLHAVTYVVLDQSLNWSLLLVDITQRPYITIGVAALLLLIPLAVTSTNAMQRRLGTRWIKLHRCVYIIAILGVIHFFWQVKVTTPEPLIYSFILIVLLGFRVRDWLVRQRRSAALSRP